MKSSTSNLEDFFYDFWLQFGFLLTISQFV